MIWLEIDRTMDIPLIRQVYEQIRIRILDGELMAGEKLPPTRELASHLGISRNVVIEAYEQLLAEGYIEARQGSGTYVAEGAFLNQQKKKDVLSFVEIHQSEENANDVIDFRSGIPALNLFPRNTWGKIAKEVCLNATNSVFGYGYPEGRAELRYILSQYLKRMRGVDCHPDQIVITSGATQGFTLIANLLLSAGDEVIIEDPITFEIQRIFTSKGASLYPIPVDEQGMQTDFLPQKKKPKFIFVTPSHQFPLGGTLPIQRRIELIQFARNADCFIVEDDYDSEFRYQGAPISSLQGLDPDRVIYVGTFSKILSPALRLGYLILPPSLIKQSKDLKWYMDLHAPSLEQLTIARFIEEKHLERHIQKMKKIYDGRRKQARKCLTEEFGENVQISGDSTGLHLIAEFKHIKFTNLMIEKIMEQHKVKIYPVEHHAIQKGIHQNKVILGYGNLSTDEIQEGIHRLKHALV